ncbi:MAG TPA: hypothetical protein VFQ36_24240 [Ktedonobacteraceae bacterium]|nr:hypothetical protein [Ktedonobacteraceae bacterium]
MKTIKEISEATGISRFTLFSAAKAGLFPSKRSGATVLIDTESPVYQGYLYAHFAQPRVAINGLQDMAAIAVEHGLFWQGVRSDAAIRKPVEVVFQAIEQSPDNLDVARAAATGNVEHLTGHVAGVSEFVGQFFDVVLAGTCHGSVTTLFRRQRLLVAAYDTYVKQLCETRVSSEAQNS